MTPDPETEKLLEEILVDASGEDEQLWAFLNALEEEVPLPAQGTIIGEPVTVTKIDYDGNQQRGLRATCKKLDGKTYEVGLAEVEFPEGSTAAPYVKAYRQWLGIPAPKQSRRAEYGEKIKQTKALVGEIDLTKSLDLIVLGIKQQEAARCRLLGKDKELTLRSPGAWELIPGEIVTVMPKKHWSFAGHPYLAADITGTRFDPAALELTPLKLKDEGLWDPKEEYWGEEDEPLDDWEKEIIARGPRPQYEMEQILPGLKPEDYANGSQRGRPQRRMIRHGQGRPGSVGILPQHGDMLPLMEQSEAQGLKRLHNTAFRSINRKPAHDAARAVSATKASITGESSSARASLPNVSQWNRIAE
jgi:hypothetical protein